jgi:hypothetical protein
VQYFNIVFVNEDKFNHYIRAIFMYEITVAG